jgi:hypothetical protein
VYSVLLCIFAHEYAHRHFQNAAVTCSVDTAIRVGLDEEMGWDSVDWI